LQSVTFDGVPLSEALACIAKEAGASLDVDWANLATLGVTPRTPTYAKLRNIKVRKAIEVLLEAAQSSPGKFHIEAEDNGPISVTTQLHYEKENTVTCVYDIGDLTTPNPRYSYSPGELPSLRKELGQQILVLIEDTIDPESWPINGGSTGVIDGNDGFLVVTQTRENHQEIKNILAELRVTHDHPEPEWADRLLSRLADIRAELLSRKP
jgi:hypothetical protein